MKKYLIYLLAFCVFIIGLFPAKNSVFANEKSIYNNKTNENTISANTINAKSAILIDADSKRVLYEKNGYEKLPMASTTKIMTCLLAIENGNLEDDVVFSKYAASMPDVQLNAKEGDMFKLGDLLYSLMLESHNDTAVAIAEYVGGSVSEFADLMNKRAKEIGANNTHFVTPNGLDDNNHYTTAYDLAIITAEAIKNEKFCKIIKTPTYIFAEKNKGLSYTVNNKDAFLGMMEGAFGVKTGFTGKAGYCFVGALKRDNKTLISVVLASGWPPNKNYKWKDTVNLMKYGVDNYEYKVIFDGIEDYKDIYVNKGVVKYIKTYIEGNVSTLLSESDVVRYEYEMKEKVNAPIDKNQVVGRIKIYINDNIYKVFEIKTKTGTGKRNYRYILKKTAYKFLNMT